MRDHAVQPAAAEPIDMVLFCPQCGRQHIDAPDAWRPGAEPLWDNPPHRSHLCHGCGHVWRPADVPTNGVAAVKTTGKADSPIAQPARASGDATAVEDDVTAARAILGRLCHNGLVRMSIPVRPDDEDMVLSRVIERAASNSVAQPCAAPAAAPIAPPSAYVNGARIIAADGPGVVVRKLDAAFRKATKAGQVAQAEAAPDWRELAARVMDALAEEQERINAECPEHAKCYPSWVHHARRCRWHAEMFRSGKPVGSGAGAPAVLAALAAAPGAVERDAALWREHAGKLDALITYCPTCCEGFAGKKDLTRDEVIFECGKTAGRVPLRNALALAVDHIDMDALRISHCKDAAAIDAALGIGSSKEGGPR